MRNRDLFPWVIRKKCVEFLGNITRDVVQYLIHWLDEHVRGDAA